MSEQSAIGLATRLLEEFDHLRLFREVEAWDARAEDALSAIKGRLSLLRSPTIPSTTSPPASSGGFVAQLLSAVRSKATQASYSALNHREITALETLADRLDDAISRTPNSPEEQREMLAELKLARKDLQLQKRELAAELRDVRAQARVRTAKVGSSVAGLLFSTGKGRRLQRMSIRLDRERAVRPHESAKAAIDRQVILLDRMIHWIERFK